SRERPVLQRLGGFLGEAVPGVGAGGEAGEEAVHVVCAAGGHLGDDLSEEAAGAGGGEHGRGAPGWGDAVVPGEGVHDRGQELTAQYLLGGQIGAGGPDGAVQQVQRVVEDACGAAAAGHEGHVQRVAALPSGAADALQVAGDGAGHGGEQHGGEVADVDAHLQGGGGHEDVG